MRADGREHACEQIELIRDKRIDLYEILRPRIQLLFDAVIEDDKILYDRCLLLIEKRERLLCGRRLFKDTLFDDRI